VRFPQGQAQGEDYWERSLSIKVHNPAVAFMATFPASENKDRTYWMLYKVIFLGNPPLPDFCPKYYLKLY
jgi:hypothetical protein